MKHIKPSDLSLNQQQLCDRLFEIGAIRFGDFRLKLHEKNPDAPLSPIYCDLRTIQRFPDVNKIAVDNYCNLLKPLKFDLLAGIPTAAISLTASIRDRLEVGMVTPRTDNKVYGSGNKIDGFLESDRGKIIVLIDDLVTKADSKIEAANILQEFGLVVKDVVVLIDRNQGGKEQLAQIGLNLHSALSLGDMMSYYLKTGKINKNTYLDTITRLDELSKYTS